MASNVVIIGKYLIVNAANVVNVGYWEEVTRVSRVSRVSRVGILGEFISLLNYFAKYFLR